MFKSPLRRARSNDGRAAGAQHSDASALALMRNRYTSMRREETQRGLQLLFLVLPPALFVLGFVHLFTLPAGVALLNAAFVWAASLILLLARFGLLDTKSDPRWAVPTGVFCAVVLTGTVWVLLYAMGSAVHSLYFLIVLFGAGFFILSLSGVVIVLLAVAFAFAAAVAFHGPGTQWLHAGIALGMAAFLSAVFLSVRLRTLRWLLDLRHRDEQQKTSMGRSFQQARELEARSRALAESAFEGILVHRDGKVLDCNDAACRILGLPAHRMRGAKFHELVSTEESRRLDEYMQESAKQENVTLESRWTLHDGRQIDVEARTRTIPYQRSKAQVVVMRDVTTERQAQREREEFRARLEHILESAGEGIFGLDLKNRIVFANRAAAHLTGYDRESMIGQDAHNLFHHTTADGNPYPVDQCPILQTMTKGRLKEVDGEVFWRNDGSPFPVSYVASPLIRDKKVQGAVVVFQDITERMEIEKIKDELISVVGHELKTPLTSIHGSLRLLEATERASMGEKGANLLSIATRNTARLTRLVNDLLDIERLRAGRLELEIERTNAKQMVTEALQSMQGLAGTKNVTLEQTGTDAPIDVDKDRLQQGLTNLLSNAIKFSTDGGTVWAGSEVQGDKVRLWVRDEGPGIADEKQKGLFQRFSQVDASDARDKGGTGLGLAITRSLMEAHGGEVGLKSESGKGSTFFILLPLAKDQATAPTDRLKGGSK